MVQEWKRRSWVHWKSFEIEVSSTLPVDSCDLPQQRFEADSASRCSDLLWQQKPDHRVQDINSEDNLQFPQIGTVGDEIQASSVRRDPWVEKGESDDKKFKQGRAEIQVAGHWRLPLNFMSDLQNGIINV